MLKKLRIRFITVAMLATMAVLVAIIGGINVNNWVRITKTASQTLTMLAQNGGEFPNKPEPPQKDGSQKDEDGGKKDELHMPDGMSPEAPYETRYFTVTIDRDGSVSTINVDNIAAINGEQAVNYALSLFAKNKTEGKKDNYRYVATSLDDGKTMYVFLDCTRDFNNFYDFLKASCLISLAGYAVVFVLVVLLSGAVMKPVAETYKKQKQFITDANHELKTPLTVISADCDLMEYAYGQSEWTDGIREQVEKLTELTNKLVFLSRVDEEGKVTMSEFSLSEVARDAVTPYVSVCESKNKKFDFDIAEGVSCVGDVKRTKELIEILLDNAVKYSDDEGNIAFSLCASGKGGKIVVTNTTDGVPQGNLDILFERFYRLDSSRNSDTGGHGIGLSVAKAIAQQQKGKIGAYSPDGKTIVFTVTL